MYGMYFFIFASCEPLNKVVDQPPGDTTIGKRQKVQKTKHLREVILPFVINMFLGNPSIYC